jgi:hypothetical protein
MVRCSAIIRARAETISPPSRARRSARRRCSFTKAVFAVVKPMAAFVNPQMPEIQADYGRARLRRRSPSFAQGVPTAYLTMKVLLQQHLPSGICAHDVRLITL